MMKFRKFAVAFALILVGIALFAATACAAPSVQAEYRIRVDLQNGEPNYDSVYFHGAFFGVHGVEQALLVPVVLNFFREQPGQPDQQHSGE